MPASIIYGGYLRVARAVIIIQIVNTVAYSIIIDS